MCEGVRVGEGKEEYSKMNQRAGHFQREGEHERSYEATPTMGHGGVVLQEI